MIDEMIPGQLPMQQSSERHGFSLRTMSLVGVTLIAVTVGGLATIRAVVGKLFQ